MNVTWKNKLNTIRQVNPQNTISFDQGALKNHQKSTEELKNSKIAEMIAQFENENAIDTGRNNEEIPELGSDELSKAVTDELVNGKNGDIEIKSPEFKEDEEELKPDFKTELQQVSIITPNHIDFDQSSLDNHRQNGIKNSLKQYFASGIGSMIGGMA